MDTGAWQATVYGARKSQKMTERPTLTHLPRYARVKVAHPLLTLYTIFIQTMVLQCPNYRFPKAAFSGLCVHGTTYNHLDPTRDALVIFTS